MIDAEFKDLITTWKDFPTKGVLFRDINPIVRYPEPLNHLNEKLFNMCNNLQVDKIAGIESRGFIVGTLLAMRLNKGLVLIRKEGKLPGPTIKQSCSIEYGTRVMEIQDGAILSGENVLIADDLLATGGTAIAAASLVEKLGGMVVGFVFIVCLNNLGGLDKLRSRGYNLKFILEYD